MRKYVKTFEDYISPISVEEKVKNIMLEASGLEDVLEAFQLQYGDSIPLFHATTEELAEIIDKEGLKLVNGNNRIHFGSQEQLYCQVGHSEYISDVRPILYKFDVDIEFMLKYANADMDTIQVSNETSDYIEKIHEEGVDSDACDFIAYYISNDYKLDGMELILLDSGDNFPVIHPIRVN